jgi:drug/metabolite transporter (DMT)-like permease
VLIGVIGVVAGGISLAWQGGEGGQGGFAGVLGPLAIAGACFAWAIDNNLTQKIALADPLQIAMWRGLLAGTLNLGLAHLAGAGLPRWDLALAAGGLGFVGYGLALACFVFAVRDLGAARAGAFFATAPFIGAVLSVTALGEPLTLRLGIAGALMALGVWLLVTDRHEHEHEHETQSHEHRHRHDEHHRHAHGAEGQSGEPHSHVHTHAPLRHRHGHAPDEHHRHRH